MLLMHAKPAGQRWSPVSQDPQRSILGVLRFRRQSLVGQNPCRLTPDSGHPLRDEEEEYVLKPDSRLEPENTQQNYRMVASLSGTGVRVS